MPWVPTTDFEEEVVNLQPDHDFIFGALSEPQYNYPRPEAHTEYAANKRLQYRQQQREYETTGKFNEKLRLIQQVQRMACTKPVGEQPSIDDWEDNEMVEQETVGLMRYCGMGVSVEQPLNQKATIATYPVENEIKIVTNGRRKVPLFFDDNVFKLQEKVSDTSSGFESELNKFENGQNDTLASGIEGDSSFNTSSSLSLNSFNTAAECSDSFSSASFCIKSPSKIKNEKFLSQYEKLIDDTSLLSLESSKSYSSISSHKSNNNTGSFKTAEESSVWKPVFGDENILSNKKSWPALSKERTADDANTLDNSDALNKIQSVTTTGISNDESGSKPDIRENFLERFIKSGYVGTIKTTANSPSQESKTYAAITKASKDQTQSKTKEKKSSNLKTDLTPFYTTRRMYALKRNQK